MAGLLSVSEVLQERLNTMARTFERADRTLAGMPVQCEVIYDYSNPAPAWSDGTTITFNAPLLGNVLDVDTLIVLNGLNYHELAHILYSPRRWTSLGAAIVQENLMAAYNILEDARIETMLAGIFPGTRPYFTTTFMRFCLAKPEQWDSVFPLAWGRRYLPDDLREEFARRFTAPLHVVKIKEIIDAYRKLVFPADFDRALEFIRAFDALTPRSVADADPYGHNEDSHTGVPTSGAPQSNVEQDSAQQWADYNEDEDEDEDEDDDDDSDGGTSADSDDDADDDASAGSGGSEDGEESDDDDDESDGDSDDTGGSGSSASSGKSGGGAGDSSPDTFPGFADDAALSDAMQQVADTISQDANVRADMQATRNVIRNGDGRYSSVLPQSATHTVRATSGEVTVARRIGLKFAQLRADLDPGRHTHQSDGTLSIQRVMQGADPETMWDRWSPGQHDAADLEVVLAVDLSGSVMNFVGTLSAATWIVKRGIETLGASASVTTYGFNTNSFLLYGQGDFASPATYKAFSATGGTNPSFALTEARRIFAASRRKHKVLIVFTDGDWRYSWGGLHQAPMTSDESIAAMNAHGVTTALAYYPARPTTLTVEEAHHGVKIFRQIDAVMDLVGFSTTIIRNIMTGK